MGWQISISYLSEFLPRDVNAQHKSLVKHGMGEDLSVFCMCLDWQ